MLPVEYLQSLLLLVLLFFVVRNRVDFLLLFLASFVLYHWQIFYGELWIPPFTTPVSEESKLIVFGVLLILVIITFVHDLYGTREQMVVHQDYDIQNNDVSNVLLTISYFATAYSLYLAGDTVFLGKEEYGRSLGIRYDFFSYYPAAMVFLYGIAIKRRSVVYLALVPLMIYLFIGYRAQFATALSGALVIIMFDRRLVSKRNSKIALLAILVFVFFALYKQTYVGLKSGDFFEQDYFSMRAEKDDKFDNPLEVMVWAMFSAEFGQTASNLSLTAALDLSDEYSFSTVALGSIPAFNRLYGVTEDDKRFSRLVTQNANPTGASYGLGSTFWGEMYQGGGYAGVFLAAFIVISIIGLFNLSFRKNKASRAMWLFFISALSFYIHRNDFVLVIGHLKNTVFLLMLSLFFVYMLRGYLKVPKQWLSGILDSDK